MTVSAKIRRYLAKGKSADYIAKTLGVPKNYVWTVVWKERKKAQEDAAITAEPKKAAKKAAKKNEVSELHQSVAALFNDTPDLVNHPPHYTAGGIETLDFIEAKDLNFRLGNAVKYIARAGKKVGGDPVQDLEKAAFYLKREIDARKSA